MKSKIKNMDVHYSSNTNEWATPAIVFDYLNGHYKFTLDPCCTKETAKCKTYYTQEQDGLEQDWGKHVVFMNPPYGRKIGNWIKKAYEASLLGALVVCLIPARTDTKYWHNFCMKGGISFVKGRIKFINGDTNNKPAPFPSAVVVFNPYGINESNVDAIDFYGK